MKYFKFKNKCRNKFKWTFKRRSAIAKRYRFIKNLFNFLTMQTTKLSDQTQNYWITFFCKRRIKKLMKNEKLQSDMMNVFFLWKFFFMMKVFFFFWYDESYGSMKQINDSTSQPFPNRKNLVDWALLKNVPYPYSNLATWILHFIWQWQQSLLQY